MGGLKLYLLNGGVLDADRSLIHPGDDSHRRVQLPVTQILIQSDGRTILIDSGTPFAAAGNPNGLKRDFEVDPVWIQPQITLDQRLDRQLAQLNVQPADIDTVICTHFHFDHAGGNALFAGTRAITAQEAEFVAARESDDYMPVWDAPGLQFTSVQGDWSPLPGVELLWTPGHTPGHQSVLVRLRERPWLFTIDAAYTEEHWREQKLGAVVDIPAARSSMERLRAVAAGERAKLVFGHDSVQWNALGMTPAGGPRLVAFDR